MKVLLCHSFYQQPGGEDKSFEDEARLLELNGHEVVRFTMHNDAIRDMGRIESARRAIWNPDTHRDLSDLVRRERPAVVHCTNTFPVMSPSVCHAVRAEGVPLVQALRNYRLLCPDAFFQRNGRVCEDCLGRRVPWPAVVHGCYRHDRAASAVVAGMLAVHRALGTWRRAVTLFYTPSAFARRKYIEGGFDAERLVVKPNFLDPDPAPGTGRGGAVFFAGRLAEEKGIATLLEAWSHIDAPIALRIAGDGPLGPAVAAASARDPRIVRLGHLDQRAVLRECGEASCVVVPSVGYETFGRTVMESYAKGTPVVASRVGPLAELVDDGRTGLLVEPGQPRELGAAVRALVANQSRLQAFRASAREEFERHYTARRNHEVLMGIYARAIAAHEPARSASKVAPA